MRVRRGLIWHHQHCLVPADHYRQQGFRLRSQHRSQGARRYADSGQGLGKTAEHAFPQS
jgi:hypothetical protein